MQNLLFMTEISNIDSLKKVAKSSHRTLNFKEIPYPKPAIGTGQFQKFKRWAYMEDQPGYSNYFAWFSDHYSKVGEFQVFCGAFIPIDIPKSVKINIRERNILDKLNPFENKGILTGYDHFDAQVIITSNSESEAKRLLSKARLQNAILEALNINSILQVSINEVKVDFVTPLEGQSHLSIVNPQTWFVERDEIESLLKAMESIARNV